MGDHYAADPRLWEERFLQRSEEVRGLGFDEVFQRMWLFYLCYSRAGFQSGYLDVQQIVLDRREAQLLTRREAQLQFGVCLVTAGVPKHASGPPLLCPGALKRG